MALSGTVNGKVTYKSSYFSFYFTWSAVQSIEGNYSDVTVKTYVKTNNTYQTFDTVGTRSHSITINGTATSISKQIDCDPWNSNGIYLIQTATTRVNHNSDGSKSITISARSNGHASSYGYSASTSSSDDATASATITLDTIPRASSISSISNDKMTINGSNALTVNISRASDTFTHDVTFTFGSYTSSLTGQGTSAKLVIPLSWIGRFGSGGSGTLTGTVTVQTKSGTTNIGSAVSKTFTLTCPVASSISWSTATIVCNGTNKIGVSIARSVSSFTHTVKWVFGTYTETKTSIGTSTEYAPPTTWLHAIPSGNSGWGTIQVTTYYGSQQIGSTVQKRFDMTVPSYTPTLTSVSATLVQDSSISDWTMYVQKYSKAKFTFNGASGVYGSTIAEYKVVVDGATYNGTANNYTTNVLQNSGSVKWTATITDSRGKTNSKTGYLTVQALVTPQFGSATIYRYDGTQENDEGTQLYFLFNFTFGSYSGFNSTVNKILIKRDGATSFSEYGTFTNGTAKVISDYTFSTLYGYTIRVNVTDELGNSIQYDYYIGSELSLIDVDGENNSLALLKQANRPDFVQVGGKLEVDDFIYNPKGSYNHLFMANGNGTYIKFATISINENYADTTITFDIIQRNSSVRSRAMIFFGGGSTTDPTLSAIVVEGANLKMYIHKSATSTWDLYMYDSTTWDRYTAFNLCATNNINPLTTSTTQILDYLDITWVNEVTDELPTTDITQAHQRYMYSANYHYFKGGLAIGNNQGVQINDGKIEIFGDTPFIDFHFGSSTSDFTSRIIEEESGVLAVKGALKVSNGINGMYMYTVSTSSLTTITITCSEAHTGGLIFGDYNNSVSAFAFGYSNAEKIAGSGSITASSGVITVTATSWSYYKIISSKPITVTVS